MTQAADQADQPAVLKLREAVFNEGPAGVANAIKNLWSNIGSYLSSLGSYIASGGHVPERHTTGGEPICGRDVIALLATIGVDMGLLALAILNPPGAPSLRPSAAVVRQIRAAIATAIARAPGANLEWVRRHFIYHKGVSYLVIPNLYSVDPDNEEEGQKALAMNQLAGVLDDMDLVRWPKRGAGGSGKGELDKLKAEEKGASDTDLTEIRKAWLQELKNRGITDRQRAGRPAREGHADPQPRPLLQGGARADDRRLERAGAPRRRDLPARGRRGPDAALDGAERGQCARSRADRGQPRARVRISGRARAKA